MEKVSKKKGKEEKPDARGKFSGRIGYVLAVAGSAVGLGNIWRFPYLAAKYGGGMFLLVYLILMLTFGYVMIMSETTLGRMTKKSPVGAFGTFGKKKSPGISVGAKTSSFVGRCFSSHRKKHFVFGLCKEKERLARSSHLF